MKRYIGLFLIAVSLFFGVFLRNYIVVQLDALFDWNHYFLTASGYYGVHLFFLLPVLYLFLTTDISHNYFRDIAIVYIIRFLAVTMYVLFPRLTDFSVLYWFQVILFDIALIIVFIRLFNQQNITFVGRVFLLLASLLSLRTFEVGSNFSGVLLRLSQLLYMIGMLAIVNQLLYPTIKQMEDSLDL